MEFFLLLDEIDVHLHPAWQRSILHIVEKLFPHAQLFITTHSPYVIQSATDACVVRLGSKGELLGIEKSQAARSIWSVADDILAMDEGFSVEMVARLQKFDVLKGQVLQSKAEFSTLDALANELAAENGELDRAMRTHIDEVKRKLSLA
jgi:predicted ATP-binding protein involved in virulence